jgi:hypothetical protein
LEDEVSYYYAEVILGDIKHGNSEHKLKIVGLHDSSSRVKPEPAWGGATCVPISELAYKCLSASKGSIQELKYLIETLNENFQGSDE